LSASCSSSLSQRARRRRRASIDAGSGDDVIYPGAGHDTILGKGGNDIVYARDGQRDYIDCGTEHDIAVVDKLDHVHHCEVVARPNR
jgi:hypothetical protein